MSLELQIIKASIADKGCYALVEEHVEHKDLSPEAQKIVKVLGEYYARDEDVQEVDEPILRQLVLDGIPEHNDKHKAIFEAYFDRLPKVSSPGNIKEYIIGQKRARIEAELNQALLTKEKPEKLKALMDKWGMVTENVLNDEVERQVYTGWSIEELVEKHHSPKNLIKLLPVILNKRADGGAKPGHTILIFAPTELGKSLFAINLAYGFLKQNLRVLYVGNEDPIADLNMRLVNRITGYTRPQVREGVGDIESVLGKASYGNFTIAGLSPGSFPEITDISKEVDPHVVILDQLGNLDVGDVGDSQTLQLLYAAKQARTLAKKESRLVIEVTQASDDAYGRKHLRSNDIQWSNVDCSAQADMQLGIGATPEMLDMGLRTIALCKNKIGGDKVPFDVRFITELSKVEEIGG